MPLNASNVFGVEDTEPAILWKAMIREALNEKSANSCLESPSSLSQEVFNLLNRFAEALLEIAQKYYESEVFNIGERYIAD